MHFIVYTCLLYLYTTCVVWQTKYELVTCITCVLYVFAGNHAHAKIVCNSSCAHQFLKIVVHGKRADTRVY